MDNPGTVQRFSTPAAAESGVAVVPAPLVGELVGWMAGLYGSCGRKVIEVISMPLVSTASRLTAAC